MANMKNDTFTGRHAAAWIVGFFAVVIAVNVVMMRLAASTFGGTVVDNSYVASQHYNRWLEQAEQQKRLGWSMQAIRLADGKLKVVLTGAPASATLRAVARHPLGHAANVDLHFARDHAGAFVSRERLPTGRWILRYNAAAGADRWRAEEEVL